MASVSIFKDIPLGPIAPAFAVTQAFNEDTHPNKVDLGIGGNFFFSLAVISQYTPAPYQFRRSLVCGMWVSGGRYRCLKFSRVKESVKKEWGGFFDRDIILE